MLQTPAMETSNVSQEAWNQKLSRRTIAQSLAVASLLAMAGCSQSGGPFDRPSWGLLGGEKDKAVVAPVSETPKYDNGGGRNPVPGRTAGPEN